MLVVTFNAARPTHLWEIYSVIRIIWRVANGEEIYKTNYFREFTVSAEPITEKILKISRKGTKMQMRDGGVRIRTHRNPGGDRG